MLLPQVITAAGVPAREHLGRCSLLQAPAPWGAVLAVEHATGTGRRLGALGAAAEHAHEEDARRRPPPSVSSDPRMGPSHAASFAC